MQNILKIFVLLVFATIVSCSDGDYDEDVNIARKCLTFKSREQLLEDLNKIAHYSNWTDEEIPCYTRCLVNAKGWFSIVENKWNEDKLVTDLGAEMYTYCEHELTSPFDNVCDFAFKGLGCLKRAEQNLQTTFASILGCFSEMKATPEQMKKYYAMPAEEEVPCMFKCLAKRLNLYTAELNWNIENWQTAFGSKRESDDWSSCKASGEKIKNTEVCKWMYEEFACITRLSNRSDTISTTTVTNAENEENGLE